MLSTFMYPRCFERTTTMPVYKVPIHEVEEASAQNGSTALFLYMEFVHGITSCKGHLIPQHAASCGRISRIVVT